MRLLKCIAALVVAAAIFTSAANAQTAQKRTLTLEGARRVIAAAIAEARKANAGSAVAVVDDGGNLIALERIDGTFAAAANVSIGKARTAAMFKKPTSFFEKVIRDGRTPMVALNDFTPLQGGVPIVIDGQVVGAVGVSGANSAQHDEEIAVAAANAVSSAAMLSASAQPVSFFDHATVSDAFAKGAVLFDGAGRNYMIHASRRDESGLAEIHDHETDLIYVTGGRATFVTGGTLTDPKRVAENEVRGSSIQNGETRDLTKGDVIIVPAGTPHWFKEVAGTFTYYVVKVR